VGGLPTRPSQKTTTATKAKKGGGKSCTVSYQEMEPEGLFTAANVQNVF
jgi:hypothetical protein